MRVMQFDVKKTNMVKCIAIILMLIHHLFSCAPELCSKYGTESIIFDWNHIMQFSSACKVCVGIFVFLTAYGITKAYHAQFSDSRIADGSRIGKFCIKRYIKLEMNFLFVYVITVLTYFLRQDGNNLWKIYGISGSKKGLLYAAIDMLGCAHRLSSPTLNPTWWYMSTAILLVFLIPILVKLYHSFGISLIICCALLFFGKKYDGVTEYVLCMCMGVFCAENYIFEKMNSKKVIKQNWLNSLLKMFAYALIAGCLLYVRIKMDMRFFIDAFIPVLCGGFCMELASICPFSEKAMGFIGSHSMNMFLIHTLIFLFYFPQYIYKPKNWLAVLLLLTVTSLVVSIIIEKLKEIIGYKKIIDKICEFKKTTKQDLCC